MIDDLRRQYLYQPHEVSLETLALCNARCTFCPYPTLDRKGARMTTQLIDELITQMSTWTEPFFVSPFKVNEPLLDGRLELICEDIVTRLPQATLRLFTNGQPLITAHLDWIGALPIGRLEHLWISLNSTDPQEYGELMGCSYKIIEGRLDLLHHRVKDGHFRHPVVLSRVTSFDPDLEAPAAIKAAQDDARFMRDCSLRWPCFMAVMIKRDGWLGHVNPSDHAVPRTACGRWFELNIMATGQVALCCMDGTGEFQLGDVSTTALLDIYNQPTLVARRRHSLTRDGIDPCQRCTY